MMSVPGHNYGCICEDCRADRAEYVPAQRTEAQKVEAFKLHRLMVAGYPLRYATQIARTDADWHYAVDLLAQGCPPATAVEIVI